MTHRLALGVDPLTLENCSNPVRRGDADRGGDAYNLQLAERRQRGSL
jgi:hypothetical protein